MANKRVIISISGGVANVDESPEDVDVVIRDYDIDSWDEENIMEDESGRYSEQIWPGG